MLRTLSATAAAVWLAGAATPPPVPGSDLQVTLRLPAPDAQGRLAYVEVVEALPAVDVPAGRPVLRMPLVLSNVRTSAADVAAVEARDGQGPVTLTPRDDPPAAPGATTPAQRRWFASRAVSGPLTVTYRAPVSDAPNPRGAAPPFELRSEGGGVSGLLGGFLLAPQSDRPLRLALRWDLAAAGAGAIGVSNLGVGDAVDAQARDPEDVANTYVMGGVLGRYPATPGPDRFLAVWQGRPPFDAAALTAWTRVLYGRDLRTFRPKVRPPFNVFLRSNPINAGGGVEVRGSFVGTFDDKTRPDAFKLTLSHEMVHTFVGGLDAPDELAASWYSEGLAVFYQRELPRRAGLITDQAFLDDVNETAARYYTDVLNTTPNADIAARFWADTRVRVLPYDRGALYFATVDAAVRRRSHGARSLDDLLLGMLAEREAGRPLTEAAWRARLQAELGADGVRDFEAMKAGRFVVPSSDAFGACYQRKTRPLRRYDLGFTPDVLVEPRRIVRGLDSRSAAARAGLRDGDEILRPVPQDMIQADQQARLTLAVRREGRDFPISYLPRGERVSAYQWVSSACR